MRCKLLILTRVVSRDSARMLGQSPMPSQRVVVLNAGIIYGLPVLDFSFTLLPPKSYLMQYRTWPYEFGLPLMDRFSGANYTWVKAGHQGLVILLLSTE